jgi:hypothetical protein
MLLWVILGSAVTGLAFWIVTSTATIPPHPLPLLLLALVFCVPPLGTFWMLYAVIRHERHPLSYVLLAFVPYFFVGYYFERVRRKGLEKNQQTRS